MTREMYFIYFFFLILFPGGCQNSKTHPSPGDEVSKDINIKREAVLSHTPLLITPDASNVLALDYLVIETQKGEKKTFFGAVNESFMNEESGYYTISYPFVITGNIDFSTLRFALHRKMGNSIRINGETVFPLPHSYFLTKEYLLYEIGSHSNYGKNTCSVQVERGNMPHKWTAYLLGTFSLLSSETGFEVSQPMALQTGNWVEQGMPFYTGAVTYSKIYILEDKQAGYTLTLPEWSGDRAEIYINNQLICLTKTGEKTIDITPYITTGENTIDIKVYALSHNIKGAYYSVDSLNKMPLPGDSYRFLPSGLYFDFLVEKHPEPVK